MFTFFAVVVVVGPWYFGQFCGGCRHPENLDIAVTIVVVCPFNRGFGISCVSKEHENMMLWERKIENNYNRTDQIPVNWVY